jgi:hypothetical protein
LAYFIDLNITTLDKSDGIPFQIASIEIQGAEASFIYNQCGADLGLS